MQQSQSSKDEASQRQSSERQSRQNEIEEEEDDVISNSSSFSQFSINGSQKRSVGKISRKIVNWWNINIYLPYLQAIKAKSKEDPWSWADIIIEIFYKAFTI